MPYHQVPAEDRDRFLPAGTTLEEADAVSNRFFSLTSPEGDGRYRPDARDRAIAEALYDGGIANIDRRFGELIELLRRNGTLDNTLIIVTADHGELFGEHEMYGHDHGLYHPLVHVPLVLRLPGRVPSGARLETPVQLVDLFLTVLELAGQLERRPVNAYGRSLWPVLAGVPEPVRPVFAELSKPTVPHSVEAVRRLGFDPATYALESVQLGELRLIQGPGHMKRLYDLAKDPGETIDAAAERPEELEVLGALLERFAQRNKPAGTTAGSTPPVMDAATTERLKALGYVR